MTRTPDQTYTLDATSFPGGVALLFAGRTNGAGRLVDLYSDTGSYLETMILPRPTLRIAGNRERIYGLAQHRDSIMVESYILPWSIRAAIPPEATQNLQVTSLMPPKDAVRNPSRRHQPK